MFSYQTIANKSYLICLYLAILTAIVAPISTALTNLCGLIMIITWLISGKAIDSLKISYQQAAGKMVLVFFAWLLIGTLYADNNWSAKWSSIWDWKELIYFFILLGLFYHDNWKERFIKAYVYFMIIVAFATTILWSMDIIIREGDGIGIFMTNYLSQSMAFIAAIVACIFLIQSASSRPQKYFLLIGVLFLIFNVFYVSGARSGYVALTFAIVFSISNIYGLKKMPHILAVCSIFLILFFLTSTNMQERLYKGIDEFVNVDIAPVSTSIGWRIVFAKNTVELIKDKPIFGYGTSAFKPIYSHHVSSIYNNNDWRSAAATDPHNIYLFICLENGLIGLLIFLGYIYISIRQGLQHPPYGKIAVGFLIAISAASLFNSHFKTFSEGHLLAFFTGILLAQYKK